MIEDSALKRAIRLVDSSDKHNGKPVISIAICGPSYCCGVDVANERLIGAVSSEAQPSSKSSTELTLVQSSRVFKQGSTYHL